MKKNRTNVCGIGINDADYVINRSEKIDGVWRVTSVCPFYQRWKSMITRCYSKSFQNKSPFYKGCTVCDDWIYFSNFKRWMEQQDWQGNTLDKDLLVPGNRVYSPETCIFVSAKVNSFLVNGKGILGDLPTGVTRSKGGNAFNAVCCSVESGKQEYLGRFQTPEEAHATWLAFKLKQAHILAKSQKDERIAKALIEKYENYKDNRND